MAISAERDEMRQMNAVPIQVAAIMRPTGQVSARHTPT